MLGCLTEANIKGFKGWCWNEENDAVEKVTIKIFRGHKCVKVLGATASLFQNELKKNGIGNGYHAFDRSYSFAPLGNGIYTVIAYAPDGSRLSEPLQVNVDIPKNKYFTYITEEGETATSIAQKILSDARYAKVIMDINNVPDDMVEGTKLLLPLDWS